MTQFGLVFSVAEGGGDGIGGSKLQVAGPKTSMSHLEDTLQSRRNVRLPQSPAIIFCADFFRD